MTLEKLSKSPLREAVIDLRVRAAGDVSGNDFGQLKDVLLPNYPIHEQRIGVEAQIQMKDSDNVAPTVRRESVGSFFRSEDRTNVVQFRVDGFTFSRLRPYTSWDEVLPEAMRLWNLYREIAHPQQVTRLATRYINELPFDGEGRDFEEVLTAEIPIPPNLPDQVSQFFLRVTIHDSSNDLAAHVLQSFVSTRGEPATIILDIDSFAQPAEALRPDSTGQITSRLEDLHGFTESIFIESLNSTFLETLK